MKAAAARDRLEAACAKAAGSVCASPGVMSPTCAFALLDPLGRAVAEAATETAMEGVVSGCAQALLERFPAASLGPDTLLLTNDPYGGGIDSGTLFLFRPLFAAGRLAGLAGSVVVHPDFGAMRGDAATFGREITHEGFRLPPLVLRSAAGTLPAVVTAMVAANVRDGAAALARLEAQREALFGLADEGPDVAAIPLAMNALAAAAAARLRERDPMRRQIPPHGASGRPGATIVLDGASAVVALEGGPPPGSDDDHCSLTACRAAALAALSQRLEIPSLSLATVFRLEPPANARYAAVYPLAVADWSLAAAAVRQAVEAAFEEPSEGP